jgi:hypothetical protein
MTARRRLLIAAGRLTIAGAAVVALTGCERPGPIVTVVSGTSSEWKEADVFCFEGQALERGDCAERDTEPVRLEVSPGQRIGVDVSKTVVERGWFIELSSPGGEGEAQSSDVQVDRHYFSFTAPDVGPEGLRLTVKSLGEQGPRGPHSGEWTFDLVGE